jgi:hypothetical protein
MKYSERINPIAMKPLPRKGERATPSKKDSAASICNKYTSLNEMPSLLNMDTFPVGAHNA